MNNYIGSLTNYPLPSIDLPVLIDLPNPDFEIPKVQDRVEFVAQSAINPLTNSIDNKQIDNVNLFNPFENRAEGNLFTLEEDLEIFYAKVSDKSNKQIAEILHGKTGEQIRHHWEYLTQLDPDLKKKVLKARLGENISRPVEHVQPSQKRKIAVRIEPSQPLNGHVKSKYPVYQFQLVFSSPNSLGLVCINKDTVPLFTHLEDQILIGGKVANETVKQIAKCLPEKTTEQINHRWRQMRRLNPDLSNIVERAILQKVNLLYLDHVQPAFVSAPSPDIHPCPIVAPSNEEQPLEKRKVDVIEVPVQRPKKYKLSTKAYVDFRLVFSSPIASKDVIIKRGKSNLFSEHEDQILIGGKVANQTVKQIAKCLPGKTTEQISQRWNLLKRPNPDLKNIVKLAILQKVNFLYLEHVKPAAVSDHLSFLLPDAELIDAKSTNKN